MGGNGRYHRCLLLWSWAVTALEIRVLPARTGDDPNSPDIGHNLAQTEYAHAVEIRFMSVFCKVLPETGRYGWQKSIPYHHVERMRSIMCHTVDTAV